MWYVYCATHSPSLHQSKSVIEYKTWSSSWCIFFFCLSSCYFFLLRFKYFPHTLFSNSLCLNHICNGLYKQTLYEHNFLVLFLHQSSLELMKIKKELIFFHFLFFCPTKHTELTNSITCIFIITNFDTTNWKWWLQMCETQQRWLGTACHKL